MNISVTLSVTKGPGCGSSWVFNKPGSFMIGRGDDVDYQLSADDPYASRKHAYLEISPPACSLINLSRTNPSRVNGKAVAEQQLLKDGDLIELGIAKISVAVVGFSDRIEEVFPENEPCVKPVAGRSAGQSVAYCLRCGKDVSEHADVDRRAAELAGAALYSCPDCLPMGDEYAGFTCAEYTVRKCLGEGGFGRVYLAWQPQTWRLAAVKHIHDLPREAALRFEREIRILGEFKDPHVVRYYGSGLWDGKPYIATEYLPGGDLHTLKLRTKIDKASSVQIVTTLLDGLRELHTRGIVHRDIKPPNILMRSLAAGGAGLEEAVIADFGLARSYAISGGLCLTRPNVPLGTYMYMPPEQVRNAHTVTHTADLYSAGVILYYLLTSCYPFDFPTPEEVEDVMRRFGRIRNRFDAIRMLMEERRIRHPLQIILEDEPIPAAKRNPRIPARLCAVVDKSVAKESRQRFQSADEMKRELAVFASSSALVGEGA